MAWFLYESKVVVDASGGLAAGAVGQVFAPGDTGHTTPLPVRDLAGVVKTEIAVLGLGYTEEFEVENHKVVIWVSTGMPPQILTSITGVVASADSAAAASQSSALAAQAAAQAADASRVAAELLSGGQAGSPVGHHHIASDIDDFREAAQDAVAAMFTGGNVTAVYNDNGDGSGTITLTAAGGGTADPESIRNVIGAAMLGTGLISVTYDPVSDTITVTTTATKNQTDAYLLNRANHTGLSPISGVNGLQTALDGKENRTRERVVWYNRTANAWPTTLPTLSATNPLGPEFHLFRSWFDVVSARPPLKVGDGWEAHPDDPIWLALQSGPVTP